MKRRSPDELVTDVSGVMMTEYAVVLTLVSLVGVAALALIGAPLLEKFRTMQVFINLPFP